MAPFFKSKFFKFSALSLSLVAVSTPFWLFNSEQSMVRPSLSKASQATHGTIDLTSLKEDSSSSLPKATGSNLNNTQATTPSVKPRSNSDKALNAPAPDYKQESKDSRAKLNASTSKEQDKDNKLGATTTDKTSPKDSKSTTITGKVEEPSFSESTVGTDGTLAKVDENLSLEQKVKAIRQSQTKEEQEEYLRSLEERHDMVEAAIASIAENSKMYLPPLISDRALVVTFAVPVLEGKGKLDKEDKDYGIDVVTGATLVKDEQGTSTLISYIATTLGQESGTPVYYINPARTYPKQRNQLYQFALNELTTKRYPEITDDVPLHLDDYDTIYLCYPIWWDDMPGALYSFLIKYDLSDKTIIPVCLHSGDSFAETINTITTYEPHAIIYKQGLEISTKDNLSALKIRGQIRAFLQRLVTDFN